jgi:SAM-dependent methyltransferase
MMAEPVSPSGIMQLGMAFWGSKVLLSAVELGVFSELASGPKDAAQLRNRLGLHERGATDFLDALVALKMLDRQGTVYRNTPEADTYLDRAKPCYIGGLLEMANARLYGFWGRLTAALQTGLPQNEVRDNQDLFAALYSDPVQLEKFLRAMTGVSLLTARAIAAAFPWASYQSFADVGCAQGGFSVALAASHHHLSGIGYDLPPVRPVFEKYVGEQGLTERLRFREGDFFKDPLPAVDVIVMGHVLHDWNLQQKQTLVQKAYDALRSGGTLLVYETIIDDDRRDNAFGLLMSLNMLIETLGGSDFTAADCMGWMRQAGFTDTRVQHLQGPDSMVIGRK